MSEQERQVLARIAEKIDKLPEYGEQFIDGVVTGLSLAAAKRAAENEKESA